MRLRQSRREGSAACRARKALLALAAAALFAFASTPLAYGDFSATSRVLGVGRLQSATPVVTVPVEQRLDLESLESNSEPASVEALSAPIEREVIVPPVVLPDPPAEAVLAPSEEQAVGGWITTIATNYATSGDGFLGKGTASGAITTETSMGVAHKNLPLGTQIELYCPRTGLSCIATVNDRGPYDGRPDSFDFQMGVTAALGNNSGWYTVQYRVIG
ncbi:MAG: septal ring lytic transglycosylase RlpA family protein [Coriobacteriales bacterium]|nr:septal ring lytic transglycosylase RlpA family protein [Coriobacteriales bacterium]